MTTPNVCGMPTDWWAFIDGRFKPLGICEDFDEADAKCPGTAWLVDRTELELIFQQISEELK